MKRILAGEHPEFVEADDTADLGKDNEMAELKAELEALGIGSILEGTGMTLLEVELALRRAADGDGMEKKYDPSTKWRELLHRQPPLKSSMYGTFGYAGEQRNIYETLHSRPLPIMW